MQETSKENNEKRIQWHPAFCSAVQLIFRNEAISLDYEKEYLLNSKPLQIDLLIIKKPSNYKLQNLFGHLFKGHNLLEYKSPDDELGIDTYYKVYAYACLYKAGGITENSILADDITISLIRHRKPIKLLRYFSQKNYQIFQPYPGFYYVKKEALFDLQIIVTRELTEESLIWLRALDPQLSKEERALFLSTAAKTAAQGWRELMNSVLEVVMSIQKKRLIKEKGEEEMMCEALREIMADELKEALETGAIDGENRMSRLISLLFDLDRSEDAKKAAINPEYRRQLFAEFHL